MGWDYPPQVQPVSIAQTLPVAVQGTVPTASPYFTSSTPVKTVTSVLMASVQIAAANPDRKGFIIFNNSANSTYIGFANPVVAANCARVIATFTSWDWVYPLCYTGPIYAIRNSGSGAVTVWEFT